MSEMKKIDHQSISSFVNGVDVGWHKQPAFLSSLKSFHEKCARQPDRKKVNVIQEILRAALEEKLGKTSFRCVRTEYTGSSFEGAKVPKTDDDPDFEFDMLFVIEGGHQLQRVVDLDPDVPGFVFLEPRDNNIHEHRFQKQLVKVCDGKKTLSADKFLSDFQRVLAECISEIGDMREVVAEKDLHTDYLIKLRRHGPAIQMDVYLNDRPDTEAQYEVSGEGGRTEVGLEYGVREDATADKEQSTGTEDEEEDRLEEEEGKGGISYEKDGCVKQNKYRTEDTDEEATSGSRLEDDKTVVPKGQISSESEQHGPETRQEVCFKFRLASKAVITNKELSKLKKLYSVDVVPTLHVPSRDHDTEGEYYVAKPVKGHDDRPEELKSAWRRSYSLEAKNILKRADQENTCKKMVFRILKAIRNRECGLHKLNTYHLKNALLKEIRDAEGSQEPKKDWSMDSLALRFMDVLERLIAEYDPGQQMSEYFIPDIDLLKHMPETTRKNIHCRLKRLRNSEKQMMRILEGKKKKRRPRRNPKKSPEA